MRKAQKKKKIAEEEKQNCRREEKRKRCPPHKLDQLVKGVQRKLHENLLYSEILWHLWHAYPYVHNRKKD